MPSAFSATGKPSAVGRGDRFAGIGGAPPGGTGSPASASSALASASSGVHRCAVRPSRRTARRRLPPCGVDRRSSGAETGRAHASPMNAAASAASIASAMPCIGTMPRRSSSAAWLSGRFSGHRGDDRAARLVGLQRRLEGVDRRPPVGVRAAVAAREIEHQHVEVEAAGDHRREGRRHRRLVVPDEGVVVERIGDRDQRSERRLDAAPGARRVSAGKRTRGLRRCRP